jgi:hypothetical protein
LIAHVPPSPSRALEKTVLFPGNFAGPLLAVFRKSGMEREVDILIFSPGSPAGSAIIETTEAASPRSVVLVVRDSKSRLLCFFMPATAYGAAILDRGRLAIVKLFIR